MKSLLSKGDGGLIELIKLIQSKKNKDHLSSSFDGDRSVCWLERVGGLMISKEIVGVASLSLVGFGDF